MKINLFSLFSVLVFKGLRKNKLDSFFRSPSAFSLEEKAGKKKGTSAPAAVFQGPLRPKKQTWFFFLERMRVKKKEPKKKPLENFLIQNTAKKKYAGYTFIGQSY